LGGWSDWTAITAGRPNLGRNHTCGIRAGQTYCWGESETGRLGNGFLTDRTSPSLVLWNAVPSNTIFISSGVHSCAIATSVTVPGSAC
jgi:hypothetical protein